MTGKTHRTGGAINAMALLTISNITFANFDPVTVGIPFAIGNVIGALIPDIDNRHSTISRWLWFIAFPIWIIQAILNFFLRRSKSKLAKNIKSTINHRGFAHWMSLYIVLLVIILLTTPKLMSGTYNIPEGYIYSLPALLVGLCLGAMNHILLDSFNPSGVPLLAPFTFKRFHFANIVTGEDSRSEITFRTILMFILLILCICFIYTSLQFFQVNEITFL